MELIRDNVVETLTGPQPELNFSGIAEGVIAFAISVRGDRKLPSLPPTIRHRPSADRLADLVYDEMEAQRDNPDRLAFLFSAVSAIHAAAPDWLLAEEYLNEIWMRLSAIWPGMQPSPLAHQNSRDWEADTDIVLLRRIELSQTDALPDADVKHRIIRKILTDIAHDHGIIAPCANALRTINSLKRRNIRWPEFAAIERSRRVALRQKPSLAGLEFVDV